MHIFSVARQISMELSIVIPHMFFVKIATIRVEDLFFLPKNMVKIHGKILLMDKILHHQG